MRQLLILPFLFFILACSSKNLTSFEKKNFSILSTKDNAKISYEDFLSKLLNYDIIILGESHGTKDHHLAELNIVKHLANKENISLVLEMMDEDKQGFINEAKMKKDAILKEDLALSLKWQDEWDWEDYGRVVEYVFYSDSKLVAGNLARSKLELIYQNKMKALRGKHSINDRVKSILKDAITHFHPMKEEVAELFVKAQQYKDRTMALRLLEQKNKAILLTGMYHASKELGVPLHLRDLDDKKSVVVVALSKDGVSKDEADFIFDFGG